MANNPNQRPLNRPYLDDNLYPKLGTCVQGKFRGHRPLKCDKGRHDVFGCTVLTDSGWHRARVTHNGKAAYTGPATRSRAQALDLAHATMVNMKRRLSRG